MGKKSSTIWLCESCGNEFSVWSGRCSMCGEWNTLKELKVESSSFKVEKAAKDVNFSKIDEISITSTGRTKTGISEFDRVMGGGIVAGSVILIGGEPGIGKSTLLLQVADKIANTYYVSAEESAGQIKIRADRLKIGNKNIHLSSEANLDAVLARVRRENPGLLIIDSIQTVFTSQYDSTPGSLVQVRECGMLLQQFAKSSGVPTIIIGHVTKEGNLAGPRMLEHLVDTVLYLEGERFNDARILRGVKNRFGATNEIGIFTMEEIGMKEVTNPSSLFLLENTASPGSAVTIALEGTRPILVEVQALTMPTNFGYPKRASSGFDLNRLNLLAAVISKKTNINLSNHDIYLNIVGGFRLGEPAADLSVCAAIISSFRNKPLPSKSCFIGEVGLLGEVRPVIRIKDRTKEAKALGYSVQPEIKSLGDLVLLL